MLAVVALIAAPAALANSDTIPVTATVQFSGVVEPPRRATPASATIDWGDGTTGSPADGEAVTIAARTFAVSGTHT